MNLLLSSSTLSISLKLSLFRDEAPYFYLSINAGKFGYSFYGSFSRKSFFSLLIVLNFYIEILS
jgi:hypothetical protein